MIFVSLNKCINTFYDDGKTKTINELKFLMGKLKIGAQLAFQGIDLDCLGHLNSLDLSHDVWTLNSGKDSVLCIVASLMDVVSDERWKKRSFILGVFSFKNLRIAELNADTDMEIIKKSAKNCLKLVQHVLKLFDLEIENCVNSATQDNTSSSIQTFKTDETDFVNVIGCHSHLINIFEKHAVEDKIQLLEDGDIKIVDNKIVFADKIPIPAKDLTKQKIDDVLSEIQAITVTFKSSNQRKDILQTEIKRQGLKDLQLQLMGETRLLSVNL